MIRHDHNTNFSSCLNSKRFLYTLEFIGDILKLFQTIGIGFQGLTSCSRSCCGNCISSLYNTRDQRFRLHIPMMRRNRVDNDRGLLVFLAEIHTDLNMRTFYLMVNGFTNVMKKSGTLGHTHIHTNFSCKKSGKLCNLN